MIQEVLDQPSSKGASDVQNDLNCQVSDQKSLGDCDPTPNSIEQLDSPVNNLIDNLGGDEIRVIDG